jgi:hypothetical protein
MDFNSVYDVRREALQDKSGSGMNLNLHMSVLYQT